MGAPRRRYGIYLLLLLVSLLARLAFLAVAASSARFDLETWCRQYDGGAYLALARSFPHPYFPPELIGLAKWYPLYPLLIVFTAPLAGGDLRLAAIALSLLLAAAAVLVFYEVARAYDEDIATGASLLFAVLPPKWFLLGVFPMTEPLFLLLVLLSVLLYLRDRFAWLWGALVLASLTKVVGIVLVPIFAIAYLRESQRAKALLLSGVLAAPLCLQVYLSLLYGFDRFPLTFHSQAAWQPGLFAQPSGQLFSFPFHAFVAGWSRPAIPLVEKLYLTATLIAYGAACAYFYARRGASRLHWLCWVWVGVFFAFTAVVYGGVHLLGFLGYNRLMMPAAPVAILFAATMLRRPLRVPWARAAIVAAAALLTFAYGLAVVRHLGP